MAVAMLDAAGSEATPAAALRGQRFHTAGPILAATASLFGLIPGSSMMGHHFSASAFTGEQGLLQGWPRAFLIPP
jgi:hypothetical protein